MGAFKSLTSQDIIVSPLVVYGTFTSQTITFLKGKNTPYGSDDDETNPLPWPPASLIYASIKQLYYSNTLANNPEPYIVIDNQGNVVEGSLTANVNSRYDNYLPSGLGPIKSFPTGANDIIAVGIIPQSLFGDALKSGAPGDVITNNGCYDDGYGNIAKGSTSQYIGNIIYSHGIIIITNQDEVNSFIGNESVTFTPTRTVYETQYKCTIRPDEFNYSLNPTLLSGSEYTNPINSNGLPVNVSGDVVSFVTGSSFSPYITSVGLYNTNNELLAVAKLSQPVPTSRTVDMNIVINMDK
jgi:hypothetical protein